MANETKYFKTPFAQAGTRAEVANTSVGGVVAFDTGFGPDYELPQGAAGRKRIERDKYNGMLFDVTSNLKKWQEGLYPTWVQDNGSGVAFSYPVGMIVNHAGKNWVSNDATNAEEPGTGIKWSVHFDDWMAFTAALLSKAGVTQNGIPDTAIASQRLEALTLLISNGQKTLFLSVQDLKTKTDAFGNTVSLSLGQIVNTGLTDWRIVTAGSGGLSIGGFDAIPLNGAWIADWKVDLSGVVAADTSLADAITINRTIMLSSGVLRVNSKKVLGSNVKIHGTGPECSIDARMSDNLFEFPRETGRSVKTWRGFSIISTGNAMTNGVVFKLPGTISGGVPTFTSGYKFEDIEVGGGGQLGCIWDISDTFRFTARDCGYTSVTNPLRIRGQVVQCTIDNVTGNNTDYTRSYDGQNAGVFMQQRSDYSDALVRVPENVKFLNSGFVAHRKGIVSVGLAIQTVRCDLDFIRDIGWEYAGGDGHVVEGGYIAHSSQNFPFVGILVKRAQDYDGVKINGVAINAYASVSAKQIAVQIGDGDTAPFAQPAGSSVVGVRVSGPASSWDFGVQADRCRSVTINDNVFTAGIIKAGGKAINASNSKNLTCNSNVCAEQDIYITAPDATAVITCVNNSANVVSEFIAAPAIQVEIARNRNVSE